MKNYKKKKQDYNLTFVKIDQILNFMINKSPIKPTFIRGVIIDKYVAEQHIKHIRGQSRNYLLCLCAFHDILFDKEKMRKICASIVISYSLLLDFSKEFQTDSLFNENNDFCVCVDDDDSIWFKSCGNVSQKNLYISHLIDDLSINSLHLYKQMIN